MPSSKKKKQKKEKANKFPVMLQWLESPLGTEQYITLELWSGSVSMTPRDNLGAMQKGPDSKIFLW